VHLCHLTSSRQKLWDRCSYLLTTDLTLHTHPRHSLFTHSHIQIPQTSTTHRKHVSKQCTEAWLWDCPWPALGPMASGTDRTHMHNTRAVSVSRSLSLTWRLNDYSFHWSINQNKLNGRAKVQKRFHMKAEIVFLLVG